MTLIPVQYSGEIRREEFTPEEVERALNVVRVFLENNWPNSRQAHHYSIAIEDLQENLTHGVFTY